MLRLLALSLLSGPALGAQLYTSHYSGRVSLLDLTESGSGYTLTETQTLQTGFLPSWLTYDASSRLLYLSDEGPPTNGYLSSFSADSSGRLTLAANATEHPSGVANSLYGGSNGRSYIAVAHYMDNSVSTFRLPLTSSSTPQQYFKYSLTGPMPNPGRQEAPHPHGVGPDPTGRFLVVPDLGADLLRVYSINLRNGGLTDCRNITTPPGAGPRHGAFWSPPSGTDKIFYVVHELTNLIGVYRVQYPSSGCPTFTLRQQLSGFSGNATATPGSKPAEVRVKGNYVYMTNRNDNNISPGDDIDSVTQYTIGSNGLLTWTAITSSHGLFPRTFAINRAGTLAAIGDQTTSNVAIVRRNTATGALGALVANLQVGPQGTFDGLDGLSSVVWAE